MTQNKPIFLKQEANHCGGLFSSTNSEDHLEPMLWLVHPPSLEGVSEPVVLMKINLSHHRLNTHRK